MEPTLGRSCRIPSEIGSPGLFSHPFSVQLPDSQISAPAAAGDICHKLGTDVRWASFANSRARTEEEYRIRIATDDLVELEQ